MRTWWKGRQILVWIQIHSEPNCVMVLSLFSSWKAKHLWTSCLENKNNPNHWEIRFIQVELSLFLFYFLFSTPLLYKKKAYLQYYHLYCVSWINAALPLPLFLFSANNPKPSQISVSNVCVRITKIWLFLILTFANNFPRTNF